MQILFRHWIFPMGSSWDTTVHKFIHEYLSIDSLVFNETSGMQQVVSLISDISTFLDNNTALFVVGDHGFLIYSTFFNSLRKTKDSKYVPLLVYQPFSSLSTKKSSQPTLASNSLSILSSCFSL